jgi:hypothetical protein
MYIPPPQHVSPARPASHARPCLRFNNAYEHWGGDVGVQEPDNRFGSEYCAVANYSQSYRQAWGWSDTTCSGQSYGFMCRLDVPGVYSYTAPSGTTYTLDTNPTTQADAQLACTLQGGHLVAFRGLGEQQQVEQYFASYGGLIPSWHQVYWNGLTSATNTWPKFAWTDAMAPPPVNGSSYVHWGKGDPDNELSPETCGVSNFSASYAGAWGWQDSNCYRFLPYICKNNKAGVFSFTDKDTKISYMLNTTEATRVEAQQVCQANRGHVVSYQTLEEQVDTETYFIRIGALMPAFHKAYWLGLFIPQVDPRLWPNFKWLDGYPNPHTHQTPSDVYGHWGTLVSEDLTSGASISSEEPNNLSPPEFCAVANNSMAYDTAWGWADKNCEEKYIYICKMYPSPPPSPQPPPPSPPPSPPYNPIYVSPQNLFSYFYNNTPASYQEALASCQAMGKGGALVQYPSFGRQYEIEDVFSRRGVIGPSHPAYWMGLRVKTFDFWPNFTWANGRPLGNGAYEHWGIFKAGYHMEPNNVFPPEDCVAANHTQLYDKAWGWSDARCGMALPFICEVPPATPPPPTPAPPAVILGYTTASTTSLTNGQRYVLNSTLLDFYAAQAACVRMGGNLVVYSSQGEQAEVENALKQQGGFAALGLKFYWIGYRVYVKWPAFVPIVASNVSITYTHWGVMQPQGRREPNAFTGLELCAGANGTQVYGGAWGWSDENCGLKAPFVCRLRKWLRPAMLLSAVACVRSAAGCCCGLRCLCTCHALLSALC